MPAIVTASQLRQILGVSVSLYSDAQLDSYIDSAEQTILPLLTQYQSSVTFANVTAIYSSGNSNIKWIIGSPAVRKHTTH
jgi:hypothetical protein